MAQTNPSKQVSAPVIPRDQWTSHPNYPSQVLLLGSHENFRRVSLYLINQVRQLAPGDDIGPLQNLFVRWRMAMKSHEGYEEGKLYPFLEMRWQTTLDPLAKQHEQLGELARIVMDRWTGDRDALVEALEAHDLALRKHLGDEEEQVIPLLLELTRAEFAIYT